MKNISTKLNFHAVSSILSRLTVYTFLCVGAGLTADSVEKNLSQRQFYNIVMNQERNHYLLPQFARSYDKNRNGILEVSEVGKMLRDKQAEKDSSR